jgi:ABC-2 type transport system ATP-binding protein
VVASDIARRGAVGIALLAAALVAAAPAAARDAVVTSFDGTRITTHFYLADGLAPGQRAPTVLQGPGWSSPGSTNPDAPTSTAGGVVGLGPLRRAGYNVVTWDPRGFGTSTGIVEIDSPRFEGRDVSALLDFVARQPEALVDRGRDPRAGMTGGSYGGGIQLVAAAIDRRIDAIVPDIAWHSLRTSLYPSATAKTGWSTLLFAAAGIAGGRLDPRIAKANTESSTTGVISRASVGFFASRGPGPALVSRIRAPTLLLQGTVDTLFPLQEAVTNFRLLRAAGTPVKMVWFCGGHGLCLTPQGDPVDVTPIERASLDWLARHLKRDPSVRTGPRFEYTDQTGATLTARDYPLPTGRPLAGRGTGTLRLVAEGGSGPAPPTLNAGVLAPVVGTRATNSVDVTIRGRTGARVLGAPFLTATYRGRAPRPRARVLAQLVDEATGTVLSNIVTPVPLHLDGRRRTVSLPLEVVSAAAGRARRFTLQLTAQSSQYDVRPTGGSVTFSRIRIALPTVAAS